MHWFKNINKEDADRLNDIWLENYRQQNPTDTITTGYASIETRNGIDYLIADDVTMGWGLVDEIVYTVEPDVWHEEANFQIKFTERNLRYMLGRVPEMVFYTNTLEDHDDLMGNVYFYVNRINDEELSLLKQFAEIYDKKGNRL